MISSSLTWYQVVKGSQERLEKNFMKQPTVARDMTRFQEKAPDIKTVDDLMKDRRSLKIVLSAFQLESEIDKRALIKKIMTEPTDDPKAYSNRMLDTRYKQLAAALQPLFASGSGLTDNKAVQSILGAYKTNEFEKAQGQQASGLREVMYFKRNIGKVTNLTQIMSDKTMMTVVRTAVGLPKSFQALDYEQQKSGLEKRVKMEKFQDPKFLEQFVQRFLIMNDQQNGNTATNPVLGLFQPAATGGSFQPIGIDFLI